MKNEVLKRVVERELGGGADDARKASAAIFSIGVLPLSGRQLIANQLLCQLIYDIWKKRKAVFLALNLGCSGWLSPTVVGHYHSDYFI